MLTLMNQAVAIERSDAPARPGLWGGFERRLESSHRLQ